MLVLRALVRDGSCRSSDRRPRSAMSITARSITTCSSPAASLTGGDSPLAVTALIALAGIAAVLVTWWLARAIGGPVAGLVAGLLMAVSASAVDESTFIWNPNLIALSSAIALAGAWRAWTTAGLAWWLLAGVGTAVTMQCHVLGDHDAPGRRGAARRRCAGAPPARSVGRSGGSGWAGSRSSSLVPAARRPRADERLLRAGRRARLPAGGGDPPRSAPCAFLFIAAGSISWPLTGLLTDGAIAALVATVAVIAHRRLAGRAPGTPSERQASQWLGLGLLWTALALTFVSPSLATIVRGLPNDHYHAFADPMVFTLVGLGAGALWRARQPVPANAPAGPVAVRRRRSIGLNRANQPPGSIRSWLPGCESRGSWIGAAAGVRPTLRSLPDSSPPRRTATRWSESGGSCTRRAAGTRASSAGSAGRHLRFVFEEVIGAACGGRPRRVAPPGRYGEPIDRFEAAPDDDLDLPGRDDRVAVAGSQRQPGIANAGAPDAGVRCPETGSGGRTRVAPWWCPVTPRFPIVDRRPDAPC